MPIINPRLTDTCSPPIPNARRWTEAYDGRFGPLINLSQAAPGTPPPQSLLAALGAAAGDPRSSGYGPIRGEPDLIDAYARHVADVYDCEISADTVAITAGCNEAFFIAAISVAKAGDAVLLPTPWYFNHAMTLNMLGIEVVPVPTRAEDGFVPRVDVVQAILAERSRNNRSVPRAVVLVTPNNPTGAVYPAELIGDFAELCARIDAWLIVDETYRDYLPRAVSEPPHRVFAGPERSRLIQLYSFSKSYCIPGHRLGAMIVPSGQMAEIDKVLDSLQICPARAGQIAVAPAIASLRDWRRQAAEDINRRAAFFSDVFRTMPGWRIDAIGAYFAYVAHPFRGAADERVAEQLARERGVLVLPGSFFGANTTTHLRFAFANVDEERIAELPKRLAEFTP